jgi:ubiquinone/menaquinone biosynthesis C-methylase UbiE
VIASWREFWDRPHRIYVNDRHRALHYAQVATDIISEIPHSHAVILDYGCGEALEADRIAEHCRQLYLCEAAPSMRDVLRVRFAENARVVVIPPEGINILPDGSLNLVVMNSVLQYLTRDETTTLLARLHAKLAKDGRLVLADLVPPGSSIVADASSLLGTAMRGGFFFPALGGLAATLASDYRRLRQEIGLTTYREAEMRALLRETGYGSERRVRNFGFNQRRMTIIAWPMR